MQIDFVFENAEELKKLLDKAVNLTEQLQETLQQIKNFQPLIKVNKKLKT